MLNFKKMNLMAALTVASALGASVSGCGGGRDQIPLADVPQVELERKSDANLPPQVPADHVSPVE